MAVVRKAFLIISLSFLGFADAQKDSARVEPPSPPVAIPDPAYIPKGIDADSLLQANRITDNPVNKRNFPYNLKKKYYGSDFSYTATSPKESLWSRMMRRLSNFLRKFFGEADTAKAGNITVIVLRLLAIAVIGTVVYFIVKFILSKKGNLLLSKRNQKITVGEEPLPENIHEINFPAEIARFETEKNYRFAIRYQFLMVLKKLADRNIIEWQPEKTNREYSAEIADRDRREKFDGLAYIFNYVWYGEFDITSADYANFKTKFSSLQV